MIRFRIQYNQRLKPIPLSEIAYFYSQNSTTYIVTAGGEKHVINMKLREILPLVKDHDFFQISRRMIVSFISIDTKNIHIMKTGDHSKYKLKLSPEHHEDVYTSIHVDTPQKFREWLGYPKK